MYIYKYIYKMLATVAKPRSLIEFQYSILITKHFQTLQNYLLHNYFSN